MVTSVQDRTAEFRSVLAQAQKRQASAKVGAQRQALASPPLQKQGPNGNRTARSEFARRAAEIGRGITGTMDKLERLAQREMRLIMTPDTARRLTGCQWPDGRHSSMIGRSRLPN